MVEDLTRYKEKLGTKTLIRLNGVVSRKDELERRNNEIIKNANEKYGIEKFDEKHWIKFFKRNIDKNIIDILIEKEKWKIDEKTLVRLQYCGYQIASEIIEYKKNNTELNVIKKLLECEKENGVYEISISFNKENKCCYSPNILHLRDIKYMIVPNQDKEIIKIDISNLYYIIFVKMFEIDMEQYKENESIISYIYNKIFENVPNYEEEKTLAIMIDMLLKNKAKKDIEKIITKAIDFNKAYDFLTSKKGYKDFLNLYFVGSKARNKKPIIYETFLHDQIVNTYSSMFGYVYGYIEAQKSSLISRYINILCDENKDILFNFYVLDNLLIVEKNKEAKIKIAKINYFLLEE